MPDETKHGGDETLTRPTIEIHVGRLELGEDGVVRFTAKHVDEYTLKHAKAHIVAQGRVCGGRPRPVLADISAFTVSPSREVRVYYASEEGTRFTAAVGVVVKSDLMRLIANFFFRFHKPGYPVRLFTDVQDAMTWLKEFLDE